MSERKTYHVTKHGEGWQGKLQHAGRASVTGDNKEEVVARTIEMAKNHDLSSVIIHKADGTIQQEHTYPRSSDPYPPEG